MLLSIVIFIFILGFLIFIHEFGHFIIAKKSGVKIEEFGIGFPPQIWKKQKGETIYSINAIPLGGFVKLYGEDEEPQHPQDPKSFTSKSFLAKTLIVSAGVAMNLLFGVVIFYFILGFNDFQFHLPLIYDYHIPFGKQQNFISILAIAKNSPAEKAGLQSKDIIMEGNGMKFKNSKQFIEFVNENKGKEIILKIKKSANNQEIKNIKAIPRINPPKNEGSLGIALQDIAEIQYSTGLEKIFVGFLHSFNFIHYSLTSLEHLIKVSFQEQTIKPLSNTLVGPFGILAITKLTIKNGFMAILELVASISLSLAIVNILPFPALDGGKLIFIGFEFLAKKPIPIRVEKNINLIGFILLILLLILVSYKDILQFKDILF